MDDGAWVSEDQIHRALKAAIAKLEFIAKEGPEYSRGESLAVEAEEALGEITKIVGKLEWVK